MAFSFASGVSRATLSFQLPKLATRTRDCRLCRSKAAAQRTRVDLK